MVLDINTDPRCNRTLDIDMALGGSTDSDMSQVTAQDTRINIAPGSSMAHGYQHGSKPRHKSPTSE